MTKSERLFRILGLTSDDLVLAADRPAQRRRWKAPLAAAACLAVLCAVGIGWLAGGGFRMGGSSGGGGGGGHDEGSIFMSYAGPTFPLTALEGGEALAAERSLLWDFAPGAYADGEPRQWGANITDRYILSNSTEENITAELLYPYAGSFQDLDQQRPTVTVDGQETDAALYGGPYSGGFQSASGPEGTDSLNLQNLDSWEQFQALLEDGRYQAQALEDYPVLDLPVTVYRFSDFTAPLEEYQAATQAISFPMDDDETQIFTYGFNGFERDNGAGLRRYSYFVPNGVIRETELKLLVVLGEDLADYTLQGYQDGGCDAGEEIEGVSCTVAREASTLHAVLEEICRNFWSSPYRRSVDGRPGFAGLPGFTLDMHVGAVSELLTQYGLLSDAPADRYDTGMLEDVVGEALYQTRVLYLRFSVTVPAGESVTVSASLWKSPSHDFYCAHTENQGIQGYDLMTRLGSSLTFTGQTAALANTEGVEIVRQNLGFDLENGVTEVTLDLQEPHYYLEIRKTE